MGTAGVASEGAGLAGTAGERELQPPVLLGRDQELAAVVRVLERGPGLVLIEGEPGIGKTRLLREALRSEQVVRRTVLLAGCPPLLDPFPVGAIVDGIRRLRDQVADLELSALGGALRPLFPEWAHELPPALEQLDDARETRHRLLRALTELVERLGVEILVLEDAHWADRTTLEWLSLLASNAEMVMSMVVTYRPAEVADDSALLGITSRTPPGTSQLRVELGPLDVEQTRRLVGSMVGTAEISEELAAFLHEHTDGIPLAVEESVRLLRDRHEIVRHGGPWTPSLLDVLEVPPVLRDSVLERVARLTTDARRVLEAGAVLAAAADESMLTEVAELPEPASREGVAAALASGLLREASPGRFGFRHSLDAQAVGEAIPASRWRRLHGRAARALQRREPEAVERLSRHSREAGDTVAWARYAEASADLAIASGDDRTAVTVLHDLLTTGDFSDDRRAAVARTLGEATVWRSQAFGGLETAVRDTLRDFLAAQDLSTADGGEIRLMRGWLLLQAQEFEAAYAEIEVAVRDLGERPARAAQAALLLAMPFNPKWPVARHLTWLERALDLFPQLTSPVDRLAFAIDHANALLDLGDETGWRAVAELPRSASTRAECRLIVRGMVNAALSAIDWGYYAYARQRLAEATEVATESGSQRGLDFARVGTALLDYHTGAWGRLDAKQLAESDRLEPSLRVEARLIHGLLALARGARATAEQELQRASEDVAQVSQAMAPAVVSGAALARLHLADGAADKALQATAASMQVIARKGTWLWASSIATVYLDVLIATDRMDLARELVREFAAGLGDLAAPAPQAALAVCRAIMAEAQGELREAPARFAGAAQAWAALPRPYDELLALERQGRCLLAAGDSEQGLRVLTGAQARLRELGARWDADRVARLLRRHGVEVSRAWKRGPHGYGDELSPREQEVLALVARGMTNREVGHVLFLSPKTVGVHLGAAMRKLGVSSRTAAAIAATEAGLISVDHEEPEAGGRANS